MPHVYVDALKLQNKPEVGGCILTMRTCFMWLSRISVPLLFLMAGAVAAPVDVECPRRYPDHQQAVGLRDQGWLVLDAGGAGSSLAEAGVLVGAVVDSGELRGADLERGSGRQFRFNGTATDGEKWFYCHYGAGKGRRLAYRLPVEIKQCTTSESLAGQRLSAASIQCQ